MHLSSWSLCSLYPDFGLSLLQVLPLVLTTRANLQKGFTVEEVKKAVADSDKQRFALEERADGLYIRANQGHSIPGVRAPLLPSFCTAEPFLWCLSLPSWT